MSIRNQILPIVVVLSLFAVCSMSAVAPWYREGATKTISLRQAKANPKFLECDALARINYQKRFKEKLGKIVQIRVYQEYMFFTIYQRPNGRVEIQTYYRDEAKVSSYRMMTNENQGRQIYMENQNNEDPFKPKKPVVLSDYFLEEVLASPIFQKCDKAARDNRGNYVLGRIKSIKMQRDEIGVKFTILYQSQIPVAVEAIVTYQPKKGQAKVQSMKMENAQIAALYSENYWHK